MIAGNTIGYGATAGAVYLRGTVGERFAVRNSGALLVCEGTGDHALEYMTGGHAVVLGPTGRNIAAGMSGGVAYLLDAEAGRINHEMVSISGPDDSDTSYLRSVLAEYVAHTGSPLARSLLGDWPTAAGRFTKVLPKDYARVLEVRRQARSEGLTEDQTNARIMEASHG